MTSGLGARRVVWDSKTVIHVLALGLRDVSNVMRTGGPFLEKTERFLTMTAGRVSRWIEPEWLHQMYRRLPLLFV